MNKLHKKSKIAIFGGSFNPPGNHHLLLVRKLTEIFDKTIVVISGTRSHKSSLETISPKHRGNMAKLAFDKIKVVELDFYDTEHDTFTPTWLLQEKYQQKFPDSELWFAIGADLIENGKDGQSEIQTVWQRGTEIWQTLNYAVFDPPSHPLNHDDLPPQNMVIKIPGLSGRSTTIREKRAHNESIDNLVPHAIVEYIKNNDLYT